MKYAHFSDIHIGSWRDPKMNNLSTLAFEKAVEECIARQVDFILISGDTFNTSMPPIDKLKQVVIKLRQLKDNKIPVYIIAGSHDFSPSGKTMLDVIEEAGLWVNVVRGDVVDGKLRLRFTIDQKTGTKITGMIGKKGALEKKYYEGLDREFLEQETGYKIFMFHTALAELKPPELEEMEAEPISLLPRGFNYYAGGHVHAPMQKKIEGYGLVTYPGALYPANFKELEQYGKGGLYIITTDITEDSIEWMPIEMHPVVPISIDCSRRTPQQAEEAALHEFSIRDVQNAIVLLRFSGKLSIGSIADVSFSTIFSTAYGRGAYYVTKNTFAAASPEFEEIKIEAHNTEDIERQLISDHLGRIPFGGVDKQKERQLIVELMVCLDIERDEGERVIDFERRIKENAEKVVVQ